MAKLSVLELKNLKKRLTEKVGGRGDGALLFEKRKSGIVEAYYRFKFEDKDSTIKLGNYALTNDSAGYSLAECRDKAQDLARLRRLHGGDLKGYLEAEKRKQEQQKLEEQQRQEMEARKGSFADLMDAYIEDQEAQGKESVHQTRHGIQAECP